MIKVKGKEVTTVEELAELVVATTVDYPSGCNQGKRDFLKALGIETPLKRRSFLVEVDYDPMLGTLTDQGVHDAMMNYFYNFTSGSKVKVTMVTDENLERSKPVRKAAKKVPQTTAVKRATKKTTAVKKTATRRR